MEIKQDNKEKGVKSINWWIRLVSAAVLLISILVILYAYLFIYGGWGKLTGTFYPEPDYTVATATNFPALQGGILLSVLVSQSESDNVINYVPVVVVPNNEPDKQSAYLPINELAEGAVFSFQHAFSADLTKMAFLGWPLLEDLSHQTPAIYRADVGGEEANYQEFIQNIQTTATLVLEPDTEDYFREGPVVSPTGDILYSSLSEEGFDPEPAAYGSVSANEWTIYRLDSDNQRYTLTSGLAPKWIDEGRFVFLKK